MQALNNVPINPLTAEWAPRALVDFTLSNARRLDGKGLTCNNLFITYNMLKKSQATKLKYKKAFIKLQSNSSRQIWRQASAKI